MSFVSVLVDLSTADSSNTLLLYRRLSGSTYRARVSMTVAVRVSSPIPETSFRRRVDRESMPAEERREKEECSKVVGTQTDCNHFSRANFAPRLHCPMLLAQCKYTACFFSQCTKNPGNKAWDQGYSSATN